MGLLDKKHQVKKNKNIMDSFHHAYEGIRYVVIKERNMHIHLTAAFLVIFFGAFFQITYGEWLACLLIITVVISLEMINTAIESVVDLVTTKEDPLAKVAKDAAAGAVLVSAIMAMLIGFVIFIPKIFEFIINLG